MRTASWLILLDLAQVLFCLSSFCYLYKWLVFFSCWMMVCKKDVVFRCLNLMQGHWWWVPVVMIPSQQNLEWSSTPNNLTPLRFPTVWIHTWSLNLWVTISRAILVLGNLQFLGLQIWQTSRSFGSPDLEGHAHRYSLLTNLNTSRCILWHEVVKFIETGNYHTMQYRGMHLSLNSSVLAYWVINIVVFCRWESPFFSCSQCVLYVSLLVDCTVDTQISGVSLKAEHRKWSTATDAICWFFCWFDRSQGGQQRRNRD